MLVSRLPATNPRAITRESRLTPGFECSPRLTMKQSRRNPVWRRSPGAKETNWAQTAKPALLPASPSIIRLPTLVLPMKTRPADQLV